MSLTPLSLSPPTHRNRCVHTNLGHACRFRGPATPDSTLTLGQSLTPVVASASVVISSKFQSSLGLLCFSPQSCQHGGDPQGNTLSYFLSPCDIGRGWKGEEGVCLRKEKGLDDDGGSPGASHSGSVSHPDSASLQSPPGLVTQTHGYLHTHPLCPFYLPLTSGDVPSPVGSHCLFSNRIDTSSGTHSLYQTLIHCPLPPFWLLSTSISSHCSLQTSFPLLAL